MSNPSLSMQLGALKHCVAFAGQQGVSDTVLKSAEAGVQSFTFLRDHSEAFKALLHVLNAFPDVMIEGVEDASEADE
jgi:hypothetical protein